MIAGAHITFPTNPDFLSNACLLACVFSYLPNPYFDLYFTEDLVAELLQLIADPFHLLTPDPAYADTVRRAALNGLWFYLKASLRPCPNLSDFLKLLPDFLDTQLAAVTLRFAGFVLASRPSEIDPRAVPPACQSALLAVAVPALREDGCRLLFRLCSAHRDAFFESVGAAGGSSGSGSSSWPRPSRPPARGASN
jgi:hypothetical protein